MTVVAPDPDRSAPPRVQVTPDRRHGSPEAAPPAPRLPTLRFMCAHPAHPIALGLGCGLAPKAPGTVGTLWAWLIYLLFWSGLSDRQIGLGLLVAGLLGWWASTVTARNLATADPAAIVWDEVVAFWLILWLVMPTGFWGQLVAFGLFRYFDAAKPGPVAWADRLFKGQRGSRIGWAQGFGVMFDDLVAAGCTLVVIALWRLW